MKKAIRTKPKLRVPTVNDQYKKVEFVDSLKMREERQKPRPSAGKTLESRENQVISDAIDLAAKQILDGTVSAQVLTHFVKLGSTLAQLEKAKLEKELKLIDAKTEELGSRKRVEELYGEAIKAMRMYNGQEEPRDED